MRRRSMTSLLRTGTRLLRLTAKLLAPDLLVPKLAKAAAARKRVVREVAPSKKVAAIANPGALQMLLHVPSGLRRSSPLVVLLHGCEQEPLAMAEATGWRQLADELGFVLLMPRQMQENNSHRCFNWYQSGDVSRGHGEAASIRAMVADTVKRHRCDPRRVFATGLSAGGAMTSCLLAAYPDVFAAGAVVAGLPAGAAQGVVSALTRMAGHGGSLPPAAWAIRARALGPAGFTGPWPRLSIWHGTADHVVAPGNSDDLAAQWCAMLPANVRHATAMPQSGVKHTAWRNAAGVVAVEQWEIEGMGHCYPVATALSPQSVVPPHPIWAARAIVCFWGIDSPAVHGKLTKANIPAV